MLDISVISIKDSRRRERFHGFPYVFEWMDAYTESASFDAQTAQALYQRQLRTGEMGCTISHYELYRRLLNRQNEWHLILEDDAQLEPDFHDFYQQCHWIDLPARPTILILGHSKTHRNFQWVQKLKQPMKRVLEIGHHHFGDKHLSFVGTVGYLINRAALEKILQHQPHWIADDWLRLASFGINVLHIENALIYEEIDGISTTGNQLICSHDIHQRPVKEVLKIIFNRMFYLFKITKRFS